MKTEQPAKLKLSDFFTLDKAEAGAIVPLETPDGEPTGEWLKVVSRESERFRVASAMATRNALDISKIADPEDRIRAVEEQTSIVCAKCVIDWSFDVECSFEYVVELVRNAPYIKNAIDKAISDRSLFFAKSSTN